MKKILSLIGLLLFLSAPSFRRRDELKGLKGVHFAHRGLFDAKHPENSLPAFHEAVQQGYGIELDVQLTKDGVPIVHHDSDLLRTTGAPGQIREMTLQQVQERRLFGTEYTLPTLQHALDQIGGRMPLVVEIKSYDRDPEICRRTAELLDHYAGAVYLESFNPFVLYWFRRHRPHYLRGQLSYNSFKHDKKTLANFLTTHYLTNVLSRPHFVSHETVDLMDCGFQVQRRLYRSFTMSYTVRSAREWARVRQHADVQFFEGYRPDKETL